MSFHPANNSISIILVFRAEEYGQLARELAEPYYLYGKALLELSRYVILPWYVYRLHPKSFFFTMSAYTHSLVLVSNQLHCLQLLSTSFSQLNINNTNDKWV